MRVVTILMAAVLLLGACNTFKGMGKDVQGAGEALEEGAEKTEMPLPNSGWHRKRRAPNSGWPTAFAGLAL